MLKIGHRGAKGHIAENTLESIEKAIILGVQGVEIDVHLCKTGELVVFHDVTLHRMTDGTGSIANKTLNKLKQLNIEGYYKIPTLIEVLDLINKRCLLNIELKGLKTALKTCEVIQQYIQNHQWKYQDFLVSSFQYQELETVFNIDKKIPIGVLSKASVQEAIQKAETLNAHAIHPNYALLTPENIMLSQNKGFKVYTWTVNDQETINRMTHYKVDGIISDFPDRL